MLREAYSVLLALEYLRTCCAYLSVVSPSLFPQYPRLTPLRPSTGCSRFVSPAALDACRGTCLGIAVAGSSLRCKNIAELECLVCPVSSSGSVSTVTPILFRRVGLVVAVLGLLAGLFVAIGRGVDLHRGILRGCVQHEHEQQRDWCA